ncbi:ABC transporter permease [Modestobacter italicus]|uniref:ABC transporter permease n=1 Tax=Modestobacter italicus (strain DSM 44449 / CECT 9708 / BC 501) TaxID=2732864 RepID=UPI001C98BFF8|nr:ABC transporter permease [Modestobacter italicus]
MSTQTPTRPEVSADPHRIRGLGGVRIVLRRELATKFLTKAFLVSTLLFALTALAGPLLAGGGEDDAPVLAHTGPTADLAAAVGAVGGDVVSLEQVADEAAGRQLVEQGEADAVLLAADDGVRVLVEDSLDPQLGALLQAAVQDRSLREAAGAAGVDPQLLTEATGAAQATVDVVAVGEDLAIADVMLGLGFAAGAVVVVLLWGIPLATDVMQEKVSRVVEVLLTSVRPWQLLAGKVLATTVIGLTQLVVVLGAGLGALALTGGLPDVTGVSWTVLAAGVVGLVLSIVICNTLMAGLAARVERQEDLSSALQPALGAALVPMAAAFYLVFEFAETRWLDVASMAPVLSTFVMPARLAVEPVPVWQLGTALAVALATAVAAFAVAGRVYAGSVLRSGGQVPLHEALRNR